MTLQFRAIECGRRSERKTLRNELISRSVHSICVVFIYLLEIGREITRKIYEDRILEF